MDLNELSAVDAAYAIKCKQITAQQLLAAYLKKIDQVNPKINAVIHMDRARASQEAKRLDQLQAQGEMVGPLHGVPFTVKDVLCTKGDPTTAGSVALKNNMSAQDAEIVKRLKDAGGILLGKTNTPEFAAAGDTDNLLFGRTCNPYSTQHSAGGSSGGSAAIVAAGGSAFDIGSDMAGSLRIPAHYCGLASICPSIHRVPSTGSLLGINTAAKALLTTYGPLARSVADVELILKIIAGPDGVDPHTFAILSDNTPSIDIRKLKIAYFTNDQVSPPSDDTVKTVKDTALFLQSLHASVKEDQPSFINQGYTIFKSFLFSMVDALFKITTEKICTDSISPQLQKLYVRSREDQCDLTTFIQRWSEIDKFKSQMLQFMQQYDAILCPVTATPALLHPKEMWDADTIKNISYSWSISATGFPVATVRAGTSQEGLPIGVQIIAKPWHDHIALAIAKAIEHYSGGWHKPNI